jgi:hypothetical protein
MKRPVLTAAVSSQASGTIKEPDEHEKWTMDQKLRETGRGDVNTIH